jgi:immune inhibitor A
LSRSRSLSLGFVLVLAGLAGSAAPGRATMPPLGGHPIPEEVASAFREGLFALPARPVGLGVSAVQSLWRIPVVLVAYADDSLTFGAAAFDSALFDSTGSTPTGSVYDYYRWASGNRMTVTGRVVATVRVANDKLFYGFNGWGLSRTSTPRNIAGLVKEALDSCRTQVNWSDFDLDGDGYVDMLWVVHAGIGGEASPDRYDNDLWSITSSLAGYWSFTNVYTTPDPVPGSTTRFIKVNRFTTLPELSPWHAGNISEIGTYCHEFGHALGLPDLYDVRDGGRTDVGPGCWSLMGSGGWGGNNHSPEYPTHPGAWLSLYLGWAQKLVPAEDTDATLTPIHRDLQVLELSFQGESDPEHFLVEARRRQGFDRNLPGDGLVVTHVDEDVIYGALASNLVNSGLYPGLVVVEADGAHDLTTGGNRGDAGDPFPGAGARTFVFDDMVSPNTRTFQGYATGVGLFDVAPAGDNWSLHAQVRSVGWQPARDVTVGAYWPADAQTPAATAVRTADGTVYAVASESRSGHLQVVLRTRAGGAWDAGVEVSGSSGNAYEPAIARLGADDLALAWTDTRNGSAHIYYRARVRGAWTEEQLLDPGTGEHRSPSIGADDRGGIHVAWVFVGQESPQIRYMRFPYLSPYGQPFVLSGPMEYPSKPAVAVMPGGGATVVWVDDGSQPSVVHFSRCAADSLPGLWLRMTPASGYPQTWVSSLVDPDGDMHSLWLESHSSVTEIHYQHRLKAGGYSVVDSTLETSVNTISRAQLSRDGEGGLHIVYERTVSGVPQVRYRRRRAGLSDWDAFSSDVSPAGSAAYQPSALPVSPGNVLVLYRQLNGSMPRFMERSRLTDQPPLVAVPEAEASAPARAVILPNPVRAGQPVEIVWPAAASGAAAGGIVDVFDLAGRRVGGGEIVAQGPFRRGRIGPDATRGWLAGVYFVRARGASGPAQRLVVLR